MVETNLVFGCSGGFNVASCCRCLVVVGGGTVTGLGLYQGEG